MLKRILLLVVAVGILGGGGFFIYETYFKREQPIYFRSELVKEADLVRSISAVGCLRAITAHSASTMAIASASADCSPSGAPIRNFRPWMVASRAELMAHRPSKPRPIRRAIAQPQPAVEGSPTSCARLAQKAAHVSERSRLPRLPFAPRAQTRRIPDHQGCWCSFRNYIKGAPSSAKGRIRCCGRTAL